MTANEQSLKLELIKKLKEFTSEQCEYEHWDMGNVPDNIEEAMADAAFAVIMAIKGTNQYRDENPG